jgi:hypothetical protein
LNGLASISINLKTDYIDENGNAGKYCRRFFNGAPVGARFQRVKVSN